VIIEDPAAGRAGSAGHTLADIVSARLLRAGLYGSSPELVRIRDHNSSRLAAQTAAIDAHEYRGQLRRQALRDDWLKNRLTAAAPVAVPEIQERSP
jgi:hypothetical protein